MSERTFDALMRIVFVALLLADAAAILRML